MAKNSWYSAEEDGYIARRDRELQLRKRPYGRRKAIYQKIAREFQREFGTNRSWNGIQQRARKLVSI